jgi:hypothetical protein
VDHIDRHGRGRRARRCAVLALAAALITALPAIADTSATSPGVAFGGQSFASWQDYYASSYFIENGKRCGKPPTLSPRVVDPSDCSFTSTNPSGDYVPGDTYRIPVVFHVIEHTNGSGQLSDALIQSQIDILNEDFRALPGTPGAGGYDSGIEFALAETDPLGNPTTGITRTVDNSWFGDNGSYWNSLAWDTSRYLNIYSNNADGNLGYVPNLPQSGIAGNNADRVVLLWSAVGRNALGGPPYDQGRTATHEVGHYLGLEHTFDNGCGAAAVPDCYATGDLICDTATELQPRYGCPSNPHSCGTPDPIENFMDYTDDTCMELFSMEQALRMRCSLLNYRPDLYDFVNAAVCGNGIRENAEECDGTDASACSGLCQVDCSCPPPACGNGVVESGEACDGASDSACPGLCQGDCSCAAPVCGNGAVETPEQCDGSADSACPGQCQGDCSCPITCNFGDLFVIRAKSDAKRFVWKAELANFSGLYDGLDPRAQFSWVVTQGSASVSVDLPAYGAGWDRSRPERGKYKWRGLLGGIKLVKVIDRSVKKGIWRIRVKGKEVPGAELIDVVSAFADVELTMDGSCGSGLY